MGFFEDVKDKINGGDSNKKDPTNTIGVAGGLAQIGAQIGDYNANQPNHGFGANQPNHGFGETVFDKIKEAIEDTNKSDEGKELLDTLKDLGDKVGTALTKDMEDSYEDIMDVPAPKETKEDKESKETSEFGEAGYDNERDSDGREDDIQIENTDIMMDL